MSGEPCVSFIVPSTGSMSRRVRRSTGSLRVGSPASPLPRRAPTSRSPASLACAHSAVPACCTGEDGISHVPRRPSLYVPRLSDPGGTVEAGLRDFVPTHRFTGAAFRACRRVGFHHVLSFGIQYRGPHARCLRFAARVTSAPRKTRYWQAALPWPGGSPTRSVAASGLHSRVGVHMVSS